MKTKILTRIASIFIVLAMLVPAFGSIVQYAMGAGSFNSLGTNKALGSPILNQNFTADDWNKWEMIVWGLFLSNFTTPFVDDYNSAFNIDAGYGSKGSGAKALQFASGTDVANTASIQDLLDYAVNQQSTGAIKQIYVSYNKVEKGMVTTKSSFPNNVTTPETDTNTGDENTDGGTTDENTTDGDNTDENTTDGDNTGEDLPGNSTNESTSDARIATVKDLIFMIDKGDAGETWAKANANQGWFVSSTLKTSNYPHLMGTTEANVPTFAVKTTSGTHETVLDYTDNYDLSLISALVAKGLSGDYKKEFAEAVEKIFASPQDYPLIMDCFGNICTQMDGTYRVIIPGASNKYLTDNPSINLVNSLVFNSSTNTAGSTQLILNGGQSHNTYWWTSDLGGAPAFANKASGIPSGSIMLYYDTDTIVMQDALQRGNLSDYEVNIGEVYKKLYDLDIKSSNAKYGFKIEPANLDEALFNTVNNAEAKEALKGMVLVTAQLGNLFSTEPDVKYLTEIKTNSKDALKIFDEPVIVPVQVGAGRESNKINASATHRGFANWTYQVYRAKNYDSTAGMLSSEFILNKLNKSKNPVELYSELCIEQDVNSRNGSQTLSKLAVGYIGSRPDYYKITDGNKLKTLSVEATDLGTSNGAYNVLGRGSRGTFDILVGTDSKEAQSTFARSVKVYPTSEVMRSISNILGVREGTDFAVYSMNIYLTYLDWYGITGSSLSSLAGNNSTSKLNPRIFDSNSDVLKVDITKITEVITQEQKEKQIMDWTYMMLNPTEGREYRSQMIMTGLADWIYDNYQKIVYGNASSYYDAGTGVTSRNSTGFMTISPYSENFMTAWFVNNYAYFSVILIGVFLVLTIVIGLLKKRKVSWFMVSIFAMVNMILILPATGEIVPLMSNNFVQNMFTDKMSYWAISEGVTNATMEADYVSGNTISNGFMGKLSEKEQSQVISMVKNLNTLYVDRSLSIKQDISKKITQGDTSTFEDVQQLRSARWMLPMIMRQFTASDGSANYVYVPLGDKYDDLSNMYWYYKPEDAAHVQTVNAKQTEGLDGPIEVYNTSNGQDITANRINYFQSYNDRTVGYDVSQSTHKQKSYETSPDKNVHTFSYMLPEAHIFSQPIPTYSNFKNYDEWATALATSLKNSSTDTLAILEAKIEKFAGKYSRFDRATVKDTFGFLWATENPFHYFYDGIKDSIPMDGSLGSLIGDLQGTYVKNEETGIEVRKTFMHSGETGYVRDVLDLEEMFYNMIPYMYSAQILAEGYGEVEGAFPDGELITNYTMYKTQNKSWLFRSNWVTKLMENKDFNKAAGIRLADGTTAKVANMMLPECYEEAGRPMVFSEAQMRLEGLTEADLSLIELKCIKVNKDVSQKWTLMINYASVKGMTKEVVIRQMALDSLMTFNAEFNPVGVLSGAYSMYPNSIDLRSISFDSVMKMLMLNVTHDTSYIYGDTMKTLVEDSDIFTSFLLLATAFICAFLIPLARNVVMGLIFFLGLWGIIWSIFRTTKDKAKISCGYILSNFVFMAMTFIYYLAFKAIMAMTATDEVLSLSQIEINTGNPVWCLIFVLIVSVAYCVGIYKMIQFCVKNYRDMGFEVYAGIAEMTASSISNGIDNLASKISGSSDSSSYSGSGKSKSSKRKSDPVEVTQSGGYEGSSGSGSQSTKDKEGSKFDEYEQTSYTDGRYEDSTSGADKIDSEIAKGKKQTSGTTERSQSAVENTNKETSKSDKDEYEE